MFGAGPRAMLRSAPEAVVLPVHRLPLTGAALIAIDDDTRLTHGG
jgi:hypothetical protein